MSCGKGCGLAVLIALVYVRSKWEDPSENLPWPHIMAIHRAADKAVRSTLLLRKHDQAFLKRSNGMW